VFFGEVFVERKVAPARQRTPTSRAVGMWGYPMSVEVRVVAPRRLFANLSVLLYNSLMDRILVIGAGAAASLLALPPPAAARRSGTGEDARPALKLGITGKGRCNLTNLCDVDEFIANVPVTAASCACRSCLHAEDAVESFAELGWKRRWSAGVGSSRLR